MRAQTNNTTTISNSKRTVGRLIVLGFAVCAFAVPAAATAYPVDPVNAPVFNSDPPASTVPHGAQYSSLTSITGGGNDVSSSPAGDYSSLSSITGDDGVSPAPSGDFSSLTSITGSDGIDPSPVSTASPTGDGFDWGDAGLGAAAAMAIALLATGALALRRRTTLSPTV